MTDKGKLYLIPTPIGNLKDISQRAIETLEYVDIILCEDTRHSQKLLNHYEIKKKLVSYHEHNEKSRSENVIEWLNQGLNIGLITDAGMPGISDPGAVVVDLVHKSKLEVVAIPGANAALTSVVLSGFDSSIFQFIGFIPRQQSKKTDALMATAQYPGLSIIYESPNRLLDTLKTMAELFPDREIFIAREISKIHEEHFRGTVEEAIDHYSDRVIKGEIAVVLNRYETQEFQVDIESELKELLSQGMKKSAAVKEIAEKYGLNKNDVYKKSLEI